MDNASITWATGTNQIILAENNKLNQELLGWVNTSTKAVNDTLNTFVDETMNILNKTFGGTPLYDPVKEVFNCLIGLKIQGIEKGLTWVHDHAHIDFPLLDNNTFTLQNLAQKSDSNSGNDLLADPSGGASDEISNAVFRVTGAIAKAIRQEAIISTMILVVWLIIVLIGLITTFVRFGGQDKVRAEAGNEYDAPTNSEMRSVGRPESAAPPYVPNTDVNPHAPYTLNPHPFPLRTGNEEIASEKRGSAATTVWPFERNLTSQQQRQEPSSNYPNEKSGFI
jgi:hypothetical protein